MRRSRKIFLTAFFALIVIVFFTHMNFGAIPPGERAALIELYNNAGGDLWNKNTHWKGIDNEPDGFSKTGTEGTWYGITVSGDHVVGINLSANMLAGKIPGMTGNLTFLETLDLSDNQLIWDIPKQIGNLTALKFLSLAKNTLGGSIPTELGNLTGLTVLSLYDNSLFGKIPNELANLTKLEVLRLDGNGLSGNFPLFLLDIKSLKKLYLGNTSLEGTIPKELGNMPNLIELDLVWSQLTGAIPAELGNLSHLQVLRIGSSDLNGIIPLELTNLSELKELVIYSNKISGGIPKELGNLAHLEILYINSPELKGSIPPELGQLTQLKKLNLSLSNFTGNIPPGLGNLVNLEELNLGVNSLDGNIPKEMGNLKQLKLLFLYDNKLDGRIPPEIGNLSNLENLSLNNNHLGGNIPPELGNLRKLIELNLSSNQLRGNIPASLLQLTQSSWIFLFYNGLYTDNDNLREFLNLRGSDWENFQTIAPMEVTAAALSSSSIRVSWKPILYTADNGGYKIYYSTNPEGPWLYKGKTANKSATSYDIVNINPGTNYYVAVKTKTESHPSNENIIESGFSNAASATTNPLAGIFYLTVQSSPYTGVNVTVKPADLNSMGNGDTYFTRLYNTGTKVTLTAPGKFNGKKFLKWTIDGTANTKQSIDVTMSINHTVEVFYEPPKNPSISLSRNVLNFGANPSTFTPPQTFYVLNTGEETLNWSISSSQPWLNCSPDSGTDFGSVTVSVDPSGLTAGTYTGTITVSDPNATNSPQKVEVNLTVASGDNPSGPFGDFATPVDGSTVYGSIPVTGWALDNIGIESVKIYRKDGKIDVYIGDAIFVEGARPDVEKVFSKYPMNDKAGWGYMLLTNFLPNNGNGTFVLVAKALDQEGNTETLGTKTIISDNTHAVKPFGAIDSPAQGGTASGKNYANWGWALTPLPNLISLNPVEIYVYVDGFNQGRIVYNIYRYDIASLFPGCANSNGAGGYFYLDTTILDNGVHTIAWLVTDNAGNKEGIGSRFFTVMNSNTGSQSVTSMENMTTISTRKMQNERNLKNRLGLSLDDVGYIPLNNEPVEVLKGYSRSENGERHFADENGILHVELKELERVVIHFFDRESEAPQPGKQDREMFMGSTQPVGSTLDSQKGIFYWQVGPGFVGEYDLVFFEKTRDGEIYKRNIIITISPRGFPPFL